MRESVEQQEPSNEGTVPTNGWKLAWNQKKGQVGLAILILYVLVLVLGTIGEIWDVEWILDLPLFRPPGKY